MSLIPGKYTQISQEGYYEYLTATGVPSMAAKMINNMKADLMFIVDEKTVTIKALGTISDKKNTLILDEEVDEKIFLGYVLKSIAKIEGNKLIIRSTHGKEQALTRTFWFSEEGATMTMVNDLPNVPIVKKIYKRI